MELTTIERKLWDNFRDVLMKSVDEQLTKMSDDISPMTGWMIIESLIDSWAYVYCKLPHNGISNARATEIISGVAYLMKKKLKETVFG